MPEKKKETISMLLDIEHLYGEHESRLAPLLISLCLAGAPILIYVYFGLFEYIPVWLFAPIEVFVAVRTILKVQGRESYRMKIFKRQLYDEYSTTAQFMNIKTIHPDGCIEYVNGNIVYLVCCFNGTCENEVRRSVDVRKLLVSLLGDYIADIYVHNITISPELREYYKRVSRFDKNDSARNFIKIIDYTLSLTENTSLVQCTVFAIRGKRSDWKDISTQIKLAVNSKVAKVYKTIYMANNPDEISDILNRDIDTTVQTQDLLRVKYATQDFGTSKVLAYDLPDDKIVVQGKAAVKPIIPKQTNSSFHQVIDVEAVLNEEDN